MLHIDEHTIELYILNAPEAASRRGEIETHFLECHGCRSLADEMRAFHEELGEEVALKSSGDASAITSLIRSDTGMTHFFDRIGSPAPYRGSSMTGRFRYYIRRHPIKATIGSFGLASVMAIAGLLLNQPVRTNEALDTNPSYAFPNVATDRMEICNKGGEVLWRLPVGNVGKVVENLKSVGVRRILICDLERDGRNEVVTTYQLPSDTTATRMLSILDGQMKVIRQIPFDREFKYLDRLYTPIFTPGSLLIDSTGPNNSPEIFVSAGNLGRSPCFLSRLSNKGEVVGEYWHQGNFDIYSVRLGKGDQHTLVLAGIDDAKDTSGGIFPFAAALDPTKIIGSSQSSATPGFNLPVSSAELTYFRFPSSSMDKALYIRPAASGLETAGANILQFKMSSTLRNDLKFNFYYLFSYTLDPLDVKSDNNTDLLFTKLVAEKKLTGTLDRKYLDNLKLGVQYWNGQEWGNKVVNVQPPRRNP